MWKMNIRRPMRLVLLAALSLAANAAAFSQQAHYELLVDPEDAGRSIEMLWRAPAQGEGPWPAILFVHGYQEPDEGSDERPGARAMLVTPAPYPLFDLFQRKGFLVAAVSQAGYGGTDGPMDFCGPLSQRAITTAVAALREHAATRSDQVFLHGRSRGAVASSMAATRSPGLAGVILESGIYDLRMAYEGLKSEGVEPYLSIAANIEREAGTTDQAFADRSLLLSDRNISAPVLLLHGTDDQSTPVGHADRLYRHLLERGNEVRLVRFPGAGHQVPVAGTAPEIEAFLAWASRPQE